MRKEANSIKEELEILRRPLTADVTYILQVQVHQDGQIALESYVQVSVGSLNTLLEGNMEMGSAELCHELTNALKVKTLI
jgi:hypothetical protein